MTILDFMHAVCYVEYFNLIENIFDIINNKHCLITCTKYYSSSLNDAHTIYLADIVSPPAKVIWPTTFFLKENDFHMAFVLAIGWPTQESAHEVHLKYNI